VIVPDGEMEQHGQALLGVLRSGTRVAEMTVRGSRAHVFFRLDEEEHLRRRTCGTAPLSTEHGSLSRDLALFRLLLCLPARVPVPLESMTARELDVLRQCPPGAVSVTDGSVERLAVPPLRVDLALVSARRLTAAAVAEAGRYASYAHATGLRVTGTHVDVFGQLRAEWYGHGVVHGSESGGCRVVALPRQMTDVRHTEAAWRFFEQVYRRLPLDDLEPFTVRRPTSQAPRPQ
jgi:hypothetical protein